MKISEMNNDQAADALVRIAEPIKNICEDDEMLDLMDRLSKAGDNKTPMIKLIGNLLPDFIRYALSKHRMDLYEVIGALNDKTLAEVSKMNFKETIQICKDSYDDILRDFFTSSAPATKATEI